jgi:hypothetical protein
MKTTVTEGTHVDIPRQRYGVGLELLPTSCGNALGHNGIVPGSVAFVYSSGNGSFPRAAGAMYFALIARAFCSRT